MYTYNKYGCTSFDCGFGVIFVETMNLLSLSYLWGILIPLLIQGRTNGVHFHDFHPVTYESLYKSGVTAYSHDRWFECYDFITKSLQEYRTYNQVLVDCRNSCKLNFTHVPQDTHPDLHFLNNILKQSYCVKQCKSSKLGTQTENFVVSDKVKEAFDALKPYDYLQICAFKVC